MILYFSGTGNSKYTASLIADELGDRLISLNDILKSGATGNFYSEKPFVIVSPIYAWRLPRRIDELILSSSFTGSRLVYFVVTMGSQSGNCDKYCKRLCRRKSLEFMGLRGVPMPDNYVIADIMPSPEEARSEISAAEPILREIASGIASGNRIAKTEKSKYAALKSGAANHFFNKYAVTSRDYVTSDKCISCGKCAEFCPTNNIEMKDGRPVFGDSCMSCYGCIQRCPAAAIDIAGKTEAHGRYVCPEYEPAR